MSRKRRWQHQRQEEFPKLGCAKQPREVVDAEKGEAWEFDRQLTAELQSSLSSAADVWRYEAAYRDVRAALHRILRVPFNLHQFGSSVTGLAFNGSDIDLCLEVLRPSPQPLLKAVPLALRTQRYQFTHVTAVKGARVPIVKFHHTPSGLGGDVSFSGTLAVRNSALIRQLCSLDARVRPLLALTKRWARAQGVANAEGEAHRLSSYAVAMLAVFYLQTRGLLPSVAALQAQCTRKEFELGWECGIAPVSWEPREPATAMRDLVVGFFAFYAAFAFDVDVVCPLLGRPVPRAAFLAASTLPPEMSAYADRLIQPADKQTTADETDKPPSAKQSNGQLSAELTNKDSSAAPKAKAPCAGPTNAAPSPHKKYKPPRAARPLPVGLALRNKAVCVQDPFALDHNVARGQTDKEFAHFAKALAYAANVCNTTPTASLLPALLTPLPATKVLEKCTVRRKEDEPPPDRWVEAATCAVRDILETVLLARVTVLPSAEDGCASWSCAAVHDVIEGRHAAVSACKAAAACAIPSPLRLQASASARAVQGKAAASAPLAHFAVHLRAAPGPALVVEARAEAPGLKAAKHWATFFACNVKRLLSAELKFRAAETSTAAVARDPQAALMGALAR